MKTTTKIFRRLFALTLLFCFQRAHAQPMGWQSTVNRISSQQQQQFAMRMMFNSINYSTMSRKGTMGSKKYHLLLLMKDSSSVQVTSKIYTDTARHTSYLVYENRSLSKSDTNRISHIYPAQTLGISCISKDGSVVEGVITDSCWLFQVDTGKIQVYSFLPETSQTDPGYITALQFRDGPVEPFTAGRLEQIIAEDEKALVAFRKKEYYRAIRKFNRN